MKINHDNFFLKSSINWKKKTKKHDRRSFLAKYTRKFSWRKWDNLTPTIRCCMPENFEYKKVGTPYSSCMASVKNWGEPNGKSFKVWYWSTGDGLLIPVRVKFAVKKYSVVPWIHIEKNNKNCEFALIMVIFPKSDLDGMKTKTPGGVIWSIHFFFIRDKFIRDSAWIFVRN